MAPVASSGLRFVGFSVLDLLFSLSVFFLLHPETLQKDFISSSLGLQDTKLWKQVGVHFERSSTPLSLQHPSGSPRSGSAVRGESARGGSYISYDIRKGRFCSSVFEGNFSSPISGLHITHSSIDRNMGLIFRSTILLCSPS
jgi:hypothetical protein